jgi:hypothetical protein
MSFLDRLAQRRQAVLDRWRELTLATYPKDTAQFLKSGGRDQFHNPVGARVALGVAALFDYLLGAVEYEAARESLEDVIRVRAIQDFTAARAVGFVPLLKKAVREEFGAAAKDDFAEFLAFESRVDELTLLAFDLFMQSREKLYELRANEIANRTKRLLVRHNLIAEIPSFRPDFKPEGDAEEEAGLLFPINPRCGT